MRCLDLNQYEQTHGKHIPRNNHYTQKGKRRVAAFFMPMIASELLIENQNCAPSQSMRVDHKKRKEVDPEEEATKTKDLTESQQAALFLGLVAPAEGVSVHPHELGRGDQSELAAVLQSIGVSQRDARLWQRKNWVLDSEIGVSLTDAETLNGALERLINKLSSQNEQFVTNHIDMLTRFFLNVYRKINPEQKIALQAYVAAMLSGWQSNDAMRVCAWEFSIRWERLIQQEMGSRMHGALPKDVLKIARTHVLEQVDYQLIDAVGTRLEELATQNGVLLSTLVEHIAADFPEYPAVILMRIVQLFLENHFIDIHATKSGDKVKLTKTAKTKHSDASHLGWNHLKSAQIAEEFVEPEVRDETVPTSLAEVGRRHSERRSRLDKEVIPFDFSDKDSFRIEYLSGVHFGSPESDLHLLNQIVDHLKKLPPTQRPEIAVLNGVMWGDWKHRQTDRALTLSMNLNEQFAAAKLFIDELTSLGIRVVYTVSNEDWEICRNGALDSNSNFKDFIPYYTQNQITKKESFRRHVDFWLDVALEYCVRSGRALYDEEQVRERTQGRVAMHEYNMLVGAYDALKAGKPLPTGFEAIINPDCIPMGRKNTNEMQFADDPLLVVTTADGQHEIRPVSTNYKLGNSTTLYSSANNALAHLTQENDAKGREPMTIVGQSQHTFEAIFTPKFSAAISAPSFVDSDSMLHERGIAGRAGRRPGYRSLATRRQELTPAGIQTEQLNDGRFRFTIHSQKFLEMAEASQGQPRINVEIMTDLQNGSPTAQPDLQVLHMSQILERAKRMPTYVGWLGDNIQNTNLYREFQFESEKVGANRIDTQIAFVKKMLEPLFAGMSTQQKEAIFRQIVIPGNHEYRRNFDNNGASNVQWLIDLLSHYFVPGTAKDGLRQVQGFTQYTKDRENVTDWTVYEKIAGLVFNFNHLWLDKVYKESDSPAAQLDRYINGQAGLFDNTDVLVSGHLHTAALKIVGGRLGVIAPAAAAQSRFEEKLGHQSTEGYVRFEAGGGKPLMVEFGPARAIWAHQPEQGSFYSPENLHALGFKDDEHYDPLTDSFMSRKSGLQKYLWHVLNQIRHGEETTSDANHLVDVLKYVPLSMWSSLN